MENRDNSTVDNKETGRQRALRTRLLNDEVDRLRDDSAERARSIDSKSTFLAIASGVVITASTSQIWSIVWFVAVLPLAFSASGLISATIALLPGRRPDITPAALYQRWEDTERNVADVEGSILRAKVEASSVREADLRRRASIASFGFVLLAVASVLLVVVFVVELL
jgi:hypothetical protein